jgi:hypothetical protein
MGFFYALQPCWFTWDRLYKVHVLPAGLAGAYLAGQVYDGPSGSLQLVAPAGIAAPLMALWVRSLVRKRTEREGHYDSLEPGSAKFLAADSRNFLLDGAGIERVIVNRKRSLWTAGTPNSGSIRIMLMGGARRRFVLVNEQDVGQIERELIGLLGSNCVRGAESDAEPGATDGC